MLPGAADRIFTMAERQSEHRQRLEAPVIAGNVKSQTLGQWFAFAISMTVVLGGLYLTAQGQSLEGTGAVIGAVGTLVGLFFYGKRERRTELARKAEPFQGDVE